MRGAVGVGNDQLVIVVDLETGDATAVLAIGARVALGALLSVGTVETVRTVLPVLAVLACGAGLALVALFALGALLAGDLTEVLGFTVVVGHHEVAIFDLGLHDKASLRFDVDHDFNGVGARVGVGDGDLARLVVSDSVGVCRSSPFEGGAFR